MNKPKTTWEKSKDGAIETTTITTIWKYTECPKCKKNTLLTSGYLTKECENCGEGLSLFQGAEMEFNRLNEDNKIINAHISQTKVIERAIKK